MTNRLFGIPRRNAALGGCEKCHIILVTNVTIRFGHSGHTFRRRSTEESSGGCPPLDLIFDAHKGATMFPLEGGHPSYQDLSEVAGHLMA